MPSFHEFGGPVRLDVAVDLAVEDGNGRQPAGAQARAVSTAMSLPLPLGPWLSAPTALADGGQQLLAPFHIARGTHANDAGVFGLGRECEKVIERRNAIDAAGGKLEPAGDVVKDVDLEVAEEFLSGV